MTAADARVGNVLVDRYELLDLIGRGAMASVYRAQDRKLSRIVAIKLFDADAKEDARRRAEVELLAKLTHPNLVTLYDAHFASSESGTPSFIVMEFVGGPDLRSALDRGPLRGRAVAMIAGEIAEALVEVHSHGVVHRDLKPANILLAPTGMPTVTHHAKLADFGIAHLIGSDRLTTTGTVLGTAAYLSPEQAAGGDPGPESDIYSLGLVLIECLTGRKVFSGTLPETVSARITTDPEVPRELSLRWASLLSQMTARDPALRPSAVDVAVRAREIGPDLDSWVSLPSPPTPDVNPNEGLPDPTRILPALGGPDTAKDLHAPRRSRKRMNLIIAATAAAIVLVVGVGASWLGQPTASGSGPGPTTTLAPTPASVPSPPASAPPADQPNPVPSSTTVVEAPNPAPAHENGNGGNGNKTGTGGGNGNKGGKKDK